VPYRIDIVDPPAHAFETLVDLGALDIDRAGDRLAALMPDGVSAATIASALGLPEIKVSPAVGRDDQSVWMLSPRPIRTRTFTIVPAELPMVPGTIRIADGATFGSGYHATTALCLEAIEDLLDASIPSRMLDVGTGSGILALAALHRGVAVAIGMDVDAAALKAASRNARLNGRTDTFLLVRGGPEAVRGRWPLVVANIRAADLMELAPVLARRVATGGRLLLSGIAASVADDVARTYRRLGMTQTGRGERGGWTVLVLSPSW
jgi:ribosomal protein L11 methyltransferase